jgi:hypothetical protein
MINKDNPPIIISKKTDNGEHSHFELLDTENGNILWSEDISQEHFNLLNDAEKRKTFKKVNHNCFYYEGGCCYHEPFERLANGRSNVICKGKCLLYKS